VEIIQRDLFRALRHTSNDFTRGTAFRAIEWARRQTSSTGSRGIHVWGVIFENNRRPEIGPDVAGGLMLTGVTVAFSNLDISNNTSTWGGGIAHSGVGLEGAGASSDIRYSGNMPNEVVGDFPQ
jgi:hypothetical protein